MCSSFAAVGALDKYHEVQPAVDPTCPPRYSLVTAAMLLLLLLLATLATANPEHIFKAPEKKYNVLNPSLVREIEQLRQDWDIKGASVAIVRLRDDQWEQDTLGFGVADGAGSAVTEHVSQKPFFCAPAFLTLA
jgi:hypothetical protein